MSLIEVLVALSIFAFSLLALAKVQFYSMQQQKQTEWFSQADILLHSATEQLITQPNLSAPSAWNMLSQTLPNGHGEITVSHNFPEARQLSLKWHDHFDAIQPQKELSITIK